MPNNFESLVSSRRNNFDFLRFLFSCLVLYAHCYALLASKQTELVAYLTYQKIDAGILAVACFFLISGFLISSSWSRSRSASDFILKRILRIYPAWMMALLFCFFVVAPLGGMPLESYRNPKLLWFFGPLVLHWQELLPGVFAHSPYPKSINGSLWTLPYEILCYLFLWLLGISSLFKRRGFILVLFFAVLIFATWHEITGLPQSKWITYFGFLDQIIVLLPHFMAGMTFFHYRKEIPRSPSLCIAFFLVLVVSIRANIGFSFLLPIVGSYLLFYAASSSWLSLHNFARFGDFSYGIYLYAFPIQQLLIHFLPGRLNPFTLFLLALPCSLGCAMLSWRFVEKPALAWKGRGGASRQNASLSQI